MNDLIFNELSTQPFPTDIQTLNSNIKDLLLLCKSAKEKYGFSKLRFVNQLHEINVMKDYTFQDFINDTRSNRLLKDLLISFYRYPFIDDEDDRAINEYISKTFTFDETRKCSGLAGAYIYNTLATSILSDSIWDITKIKVTIKDGENTIEDVVYHISKNDHLSSDDIKEWLSKKFIWNIEKIEDLTRIYPNYTFSQEAFDDLIYWKNENKLLYERLHILLKDIEAHPFTGGLGKTEVLKETSGNASKRLNDEHRVQYSLEGKGNEKVIYILRCKEHYK
jgi:Txe/YoeB family toxin of toxin-antitoxin system